MYTKIILFHFIIHHSVDWKHNYCHRWFVRRICCKSFLWNAHRSGYLSVSLSVHPSVTYMALRSWPVFQGDIPDMRKWTLYVKAFYSYRITACEMCAFGDVSTIAVVFSELTVHCPVWLSKRHRKLWVNIAVVLWSTNLNRHISFQPMMSLFKKDKIDLRTLCHRVACFKRRYTSLTCPRRWTMHTHVVLYNVSLVFNDAHCTLNDELCGSDNKTWPSLTWKSNDLTTRSAPCLRRQPALRPPPSTSPSSISSLFAGVWDIPGRFLATFPPRLLLYLNVNITDAKMFLNIFKTLVTFLRF